jgi:hypothetical protein
MARSSNWKWSMNQIARSCFADLGQQPLVRRRHLRHRAAARRRVDQQAELNFAHLLPSLPSRVVKALHLCAL